MTFDRRNGNSEGIVELFEDMLDDETSTTSTKCTSRSARWR